MAVRGPPRSPTPTPLRPAAGTQVDGKLGEAKLSGVEQALLKAGVVATPQEARKLARTLLAALRGKGVPANTLPLAVKQFQKQNGLPETGNLDDKTLGLLQQQGLLPTGGEAKKADGAKTGAKPAPSDVVAKGPETWKAVTGRPQQAERPVGSQGRPSGEAGHVVHVEHTRAVVEHMQVSERFGPQDLLQNLGSLGFFGAGKGAEQLREAVRSFQKSAGLPVTGKLDAQTTAELVKRGALPGDDASSARARSGLDGGEAKSAAKGDAATTSAREQARSDSYAGTQDPRSRGVPEHAGDPSARAGRGQEGQGAAVRSGQGGEGAGQVDGDGAVDDGDEQGTEQHDANSPAGDDDLADERRGHATLDDGSGDEAGHYRIPPLAEQLKAALEQIERDDGGKGPASYRWDVTFYRPGVYGAHQPAEPLWHIGVEKVSAFDVVWMRACEALASRMAEIEPERAPPTYEDFERALRRARARST